MVSDRVKVNVAWIPPSDEGIEKKWCYRCSHPVRANDSGEFWCNTCGHRLDTPKRKNKLVDNDVPNPMVAQHPSSKSKRRKQDYPDNQGMTIISEHEFNPVTKEWSEIE